MDANVSTDHRGLRVLGHAECMERLRSAVIARLGFIHDGDPVILPVTFGVDGTSLVFRTSWGSKLHMAEDVRPVALEVDDFDRAKGLGWSVLVKGTASIDLDPQRTARWEALAVPYWLTDGGHETFWVRVLAEEVTGRELMP